MTAATRQIYCCCCRTEVAAVITCGKVIYPNRPDLANIPYWQCPECENYVGCHHRNPNPSRRTDPVGTIPTSSLRLLRSQLYDAVVKICKAKGVKHLGALAMISSRLGRRFDIAHCNTEAEARYALAIAEDISGADKH